MFSFFRKNAEERSRDRIKDLNTELTNNKTTEQRKQQISREIASEQRNLDGIITEKDRQRENQKKAATSESPATSVSHSVSSSESHSTPGDSSEPLYSAYILMFFALFYIGTLSAFINRFGTDDCKIYTDGKKNFIRGLSWTMIGISIFFIIFAVCEAKGFIITQWFTPKWIHMLSFIYYLVMFMLSLFLYIMFYFNDSGEKDSSVKQLLCDDFKDDKGVIIEGSIHSTIDILFNILLISSIVMTLISLAFHMMKDTQGNA